MSSRRRICVVIGVIGFVAGAVFMLVGTGTAQPAGGFDAYSSPITLPTNRDATQRMFAAQDYIAEQEWGKAVKELQRLLNTPEDGFVQVTVEGPGQKPATLWVSIRSEANRLLGTMPAAGLKIYQDVYGREADANLEQALKHNDPQLLADVALRFLHTKAGQKAAEMLGTRCLERDEALMAAPYFERLVNGPRGADVDSHILLKAVLAFYRAGDKVSGDEAWKKLQERAQRDGGLSINGQLVSLDRIKDELDKVTKEERLAREVQYYRGTPSRTGQALGGEPRGEPLWALSTILAPESGSGDARAFAEDMINNGVRHVEGKGFPPLPAFQPIAVPGQVIYRTYNGVYAAYLKELEIEITVGGEKIREKKKPGDYAWWSPTDGGIISLIRDGNKKGLVDVWRSHYTSWGTSNAIFENSITGTLSTDGTRVYAVDDLFIQPHPQTQLQFKMGWGGQQSFGALQPQVVDHNLLKAYSIELGGSLRWELGGKNDPNVHPTMGTKDSFFLGPPLPLADNKLYVLNEKDGAVRLICLQPKDGTERDAKSPDIIWVQTLGNAKEKVNLDFNRRMHAAHLAYGEGILVCPTNAGTVFGIDVHTHSLLWAHQYREPPPEPDPKMKIRPGFNPNPQPGQATYLFDEWKTTAPAVIDGKVVFAAPDSKTVHCLSLRDGRQVWKKPRAAGDLYFAGVFDKKALIVGKSYVRALDLNTGDEAWKLDNTGTPGGQGVASDNIYYLPVRASADGGKEPGVVAISLLKHQVVGFTKAVRKEGRVEIPGNLIFYDNFLLSQSLTGLVCYPLLSKDGDAKP